MAFEITLWLLIIDDAIVNIYAVTGKNGIYRVR